MPRIPSKSVDIELDKIVISQNQARQRDTKVEKDDDLVRSIRKHGLISPVVVKRLESGEYELWIGQRRFRAHEILKCPTIKAYVMDGDVSEHEAKMLSLIENVARKEMKEADLIDTIQQFMNRYNSTNVVAEELGLSVATIRKYLHAGRLPVKIREDVNQKEYTAANALKALDALGGDEHTVNIEKLRETAREMQKLSPQARIKFKEIMVNEPDSTPREGAKKANVRTTTHRIMVEVTDDKRKEINV